MLKRILKSYKKEREDYKKYKEYKIAGIWHGVDKTDFDEKELANFGRSPKTVGLSLVRTIPKDKEEEDKFIEEVGRHLEIWGKLTNLPIEVLQYPQRFSLAGAFIGKIFTIQPAFRLSYYAHRISELAKDVAEIGGGFGGVAYHLFKDFNFKGTYLNFDLSDVGIIEKYFLMSVFPKKKFLLYGEDDIKNFKNYDMVLMPHYAIKDLPECEMVFNAHSLSEMGNSQIAEYLKQIDRISTKFLHFNHEYQAYNTDRKAPDVDEKNPINLSKIKLPGWRRIYRFPELLSGDNTLHYLEYYYEKIS